MREELAGALRDCGAPQGSAALRKLEIFAASLKEKNSQLNLVSRSEEPILWERHILDSIAAAPLLRRLLKPGAAVADAGSGAGFPGLPLAAVLEDHPFELLDSIGKRCAFLNWAAAAMGAKNVSVRHVRLGEGGAARPGGYAAVTERAMGQLENILPQCLNILADGGFFLAWQSAAQMGARRPAVQEALERAGGQLLETFTYRLPGEAEDRHIAVFSKRG